MLLFFASPKKSNQKKGDPEHFAFVSPISNFYERFVNSLASQAQTVQIVLEINEIAQRKMTGKLFEHFH
ncbi:hypothetical protein [Haemophilus paracuniculus]|uniref:hypothetical protein n=1 Tax=Haemophilus paracuniculus TaxID=734 RepID=UPI0013018D50|nr:hypothetical protein [Haemophilus paracuniculus]